MSQVSIIDVAGNNPQIPTQFDADVGSAVPIGNILNLLATHVPAAGIPIQTVASGNTVTIESQLTIGSLSSDVANAGLASFNAGDFTVDANGYVSLIGGGGSSPTSIGVDAHTAPGTDPVNPDGSSIITITGSQVAAGVVGANVIRTDSLALNTFTIEIQRTTAVGASASVNNGVAHFDSAAFDVDSNGWVQLNGGGIATIAFDVQANTVPGTDPVVPTALGVVTVNGAAVANHSVVLETRSRAANAYNLEIQYATDAPSSTANLSGVCHFNDAQFSVDANGFVELVGTAVAISAINVDAHTAPGTDPVVPDVSETITMTGAQVAAGVVGTNVIRTDSLAANSLIIEIQRSTTNATTDVSKNGVSHFKAADFSLDSNAFVSLSTTGAGKTITGDSGGALSPVANNWNILGGPGVTTSGSGNTLSINAMTMIDQGFSTTSVVDTGYFVTGNFIITLPAAPIQGEKVLIYVDTTSTVTVTANTGQFIRLGNIISSSAGSITNTAQGDSIELCYRSSSSTWCLLYGVGNWNI